MQQSTLSAVETMKTQAGPAADVATQAFSHAALWPWEMMSQMQQKMAAENAETAANKTASTEKPPAEAAETEKAASRRSKKGE